MTDTEKAIQEFKEYETAEWCTSHIPLTDSRLQAIQALQEKAEREKGCSFCNDKRVVSFCATSYHSSLEPITIIEDLYFKFCPHCGRKLNSSPTDER